LTTERALKYPVLEAFRAGGNIDGLHPRQAVRASSRV
jgi:hypothetical protein